MDKDVSTGKVIRQMVRLEIDSVISETRDLVKETVRDDLMLQLRAAIRSCISEVMEEMLVEEMPLIQRASMADEMLDIAQVSPDSESEGILPVEEVFVSEEANVNGDKAGIYIYCIAESEEAVNLGRIGIEGNEVYTTSPYGGLCAIVHDCSAEPYNSENEEIVKGWVQTHQGVLDIAMENFGTVLPLGFDTIVKGKDGDDAGQIAEGWLKDNFESLREKTNRVRGKQEFAVRISYDPKVIGEVIAKESEEIQRLKHEMTAQKPGMAYMNRQKVERVVKDEMERRAEQHFKEFYEAIRNKVDDVKIEKVRRDGNKTMLMNLSCLLSSGNVDDLGNELERINNMDGFSVRFTGPWAPHSFV